MKGSLPFILLAFVIATLAATLIYSRASDVESRLLDQTERLANVYDRTALSHIQQSCSPLQGAAAYKCRHDEAHAARGRQHAELDLMAQLLTAEWTRATALSALVAMVFSIVGVGLVYSTFKATRDANKIAQESMNLDHRAWLRIENDGGWVFGDDASAAVSTKITVKNVGRTPAVLVGLHKMMWKANGDAKAARDAPIYDWQPLPDIFPDDAQGPLGNNAASGYAPGARRVLITVRYKTLFDPPEAPYRYTQVVYDLRSAEDGGGHFDFPAAALQVPTYFAMAVVRTDDTVVT